MNIAARMESNGAVGELNISSHTCAQFGQNPPLRFLTRGVLEVKGKGAMEMFYVYRPDAPNELDVENRAPRAQDAGSLFPQAGPLSEQLH